MLLKKAPQTRARERDDAEAASEKERQSQSAAATRAKKQRTSDIVDALLVSKTKPPRKIAGLAKPSPQKRASQSSSSRDEAPWGDIINEEQ